MIRASRLCAWAMTLALAPAAVGAQVACLPPEEPYPYEPFDLDPELRQIVNAQYKEYVREIEDYINCLEDERAEAMRAAQEIVQRWIRYFGEDAVVRYEAEPTGTAAP